MQLNIVIIMKKLCIMQFYRKPRDFIKNVCKYLKTFYKHLIFWIIKSTLHFDYSKNSTGRCTVNSEIKLNTLSVIWLNKLGIYS